MVKRTITITTILLILSMIVSVIIVLNKSSFAADDDIASGTYSGVSWRLTSSNILILGDGNEQTLNTTNNGPLNPTSWPWNNYRTQIQSIEFDGIVHCVKNLDSIFAGCISLTNVNFDGLDISQVTSLESMFFSCSSLVEIDLTGLDTSKVENMRGMFRKCSKLETCNIRSLDTSKVKDFSGTFAECTMLTNIDVSNLNTSSAISLGGSCRASMGGFNTAGIFEDCKNLTELDVSRWDVSNVEELRYAFCGCSKITFLDVSNWNTSNAKSMSRLFMGCSSLTSLDVSGFITNKVSSMERMFTNCSNLTEIDVSGFNTNNVNDMAHLFAGCQKVEYLEVDNWNVSKVTNLDAMFYNCSSLATLNVSNWDVSKNRTLDITFAGCSKLTTLDVSRWNTSSLMVMPDVFRNCSMVTELEVSNWDVSNVTRMDGAFKNCSSLTNLDLTKWDTSSAKDMSEMFMGCTGFSSIDVSNFNTSKVTDMSYMFHDSKIKILDLSNFDTSQVTNWYCMFYANRLEELNISSFSTESLVVKSNSDECFRNFWAKKVVLGENFSFTENNTMNVPSDVHYTGKWIRDDETFGPYTPDELKTNYIGNTMAGTWVAEIGENPYAVLSEDGTFHFIRVKDIFADNEIREVQSISGGNFAGTIFNVDEKRTGAYFTNWILDDATRNSIKKVEFIDTIKPHSINCWFQSCPYLIELDLTYLDTSEVINAGSFINNSPNIRKITFGEMFKPIGTKMFDTHGYTNPDTYPDRKWLREDGKAGPYSYIELQDNYSTEEMVGTWERTSYYAVLDNNDVLNVIYGVKPEDGISKSIYSNIELQYKTFQEWPTDGYYSSISSVTDFSQGVKAVKFIDYISPNYISNWLNNWSDMEELDLSAFDASNMRTAHNSFKDFHTERLVLGENNPFKRSDNTIMIRPLSIYANSKYTGKWIHENGNFGPYTPDELAENYNPGTMKGKWIWEKKKYSVKYVYENNVPATASELPMTNSYEVDAEVMIEPEATADGYTFSGWSKTGTFEMPAEDVEITGSFTANTDTPYIVEHYLEDITENNYTLIKTDNLTGTTDTEVTATAKEYEGFTFDNTIEGTKQSGNIAGDGSLVLKLYYKRNSYNVTYSYTGDVPDGASELPQSETYKYGEEIKVPENATAEGYTFSGWIKDYINMPAKDIEITGYFIEEPRLYKIEYYFDNELDEALVEILNAEKDEEINLTPQTPVKHGEKNYTLVSNNHNITISVNDNDNVIRVYYETDVLDYAIDNFEDTTEGDGIPDKYQIRITYKVENGLWNDGTTNTKTDIITLKDKDGNLSEEGTGTTTIPEVGNKPSEEYEVGSWNEKIPKEVSNKDDGKGYIYSYKKSEKQNIEEKEETDITEASGKIYNPKTDDIVNKYLLVGIGGILVLALVSKIRRKYSRKAKKIQF